MSFGRIIFLAVAFILLVAAAIMQVQSGNAGDKNWLLLAAKMLLQGKKLYVDIFEVNPPLVIWLYTIPEWLALHGLQITDFKILAVMGILLCLLSASLGICLIRMHPAFSGKPAAQLNFGLLLAGIFILFTTQVYFFDRDHIFWVLMFPYMLRFMPSLARKPFSLPLRLTIAVLAAIGFCIKPYTLIVFGLLQALYILRERKLAILYSFENAVIYACGAVYLLCVWLFAREYITVVTPMAMLTYSGFNRRINGYLFCSIAFLSAGVTLAEVRLRHKTPYRQDAYYFIGVCVSYLLYALAGNGWGYTYNPLLCTLLFLSGWMLWDYGWLKYEARACGQTAQSFVVGQIGSLTPIGVNTMYMIACIAMFFMSHGCDKRAECSRNDVYAQYLKENHVHSFGTLTVNLRQWTSLVRMSGVSWDTRFNHLWMLPKLMQGGEAWRTQHQWIIDYVGKSLAEDLSQRKPDVVFVDANNAIFDYPHAVDMVAFFSAIPEFKQAWHNYRYSLTIDQCEKPDPEHSREGPLPVQIDCRYDIYRRLAPIQAIEKYQ